MHSVYVYKYHFDVLLPNFQHCDIKIHLFQKMLVLQRPRMEGEHFLYYFSLCCSLSSYLSLFFSFYYHVIVTDMIHLFLFFLSYHQCRHLHLYIYFLLICIYIFSRDSFKLYFLVTRTAMLQTTCEIKTTIMIRK